MKTLIMTIALSLFFASTAVSQDLSAEVRDMNWVGFQQFKEASRVFVRTTESVKYRVDASKPGLVELTLENTDVTKQIHRAWRLCYQRTPTPAELADSRTFIAQEGLRQFTRALLNTNEFIFIP